MSMVSIEKIIEFRDLVQTWIDEDKKRYEDDDAIDHQGMMLALKYVIGLPEAERLTRTVEALNSALGYESHGDDKADIEAFGYETTLEWCLNRILRRPVTVEEVQAEPPCPHGDHEFKWTNEPPYYVYTCQHCDVVWRDKVGLDMPTSGT